MIQDFMSCYHSMSCFQRYQIKFGDVFAWDNKNNLISKQNITKLSLKTTFKSFIILILK